MGEAAARNERKIGRVLGCALIAILVLYTYVIHQGIGPELSIDKAWYTPSSFLFNAPLISELIESLWDTLLWLGAPGLLLAIAVFLTNRSAVARALAISCVIAIGTFIYYGLEASQIWTFFHWRASAVLTLMACAVGFAIASPLLAESWLRLSWPLRIATYLPFIAAVLAFIRNATGTDQSLQFAISPWPAISVFGIQLGALIVMILLVGLALGIAGFAAARSRSGGAALSAGAIGIVLGLGVPALLLVLWDALSLLPFGVTSGFVVAMVVACAVAIALCATLRAGGAALDRRARNFAVGAALLAIPVLSGQALARYDYHLTREVLARKVTNALASYLEKEEIYPDELEVLVDDGYLAEIPSPSIGFGWLYDDEFRYRSFGTSFILEFPAPGWVECAYTPPYLDEDPDEDEDFGVGGYDRPGGTDDYVDSYFERDAIDVAAADDPQNVGGRDDEEDDIDDDSLDEAWSCPSAPPQLW